ncbi:MAG: tetratricopeptide repeat protein [Verrucomicrobiales bacterium]|nr:tetratricopeptide repeat protein [Verrucomicrobiales bacterium]
MNRYATILRILALCLLNTNFTAVYAQAPSDSSDPFKATPTTPAVIQSNDFVGTDGSIEKLTERSLPSLVTITHSGRDGKVRGTGTGFIISADGLIATNLHVIGDGRPIQVELHDGSSYDVVAVHAWDRRADIAIIKINSKKKLQPLRMGDSDSIKQGQSIVAFGNPRGLQFSVVNGVISAIRKLEDDFTIEGGVPDFPMIQVAIPIEMGNSGGPIIDLEGKVLGIVTIKSLVTPNLGFATPVNILQSMIEKPNPVPMKSWLTIGKLDPNQWRPILGGDWKQHAGVITIDAYGSGFGGRTLCLSELPVPKTPYDVAVKVKLDDEGGAAGLAFASDGDEVHYGFYPSNGQLRLTRFEGPDIYSWKILKQVDSDAYHPGAWNHLRARISADKISCYVNGQLVIEVNDDRLRQGKVGLCRFRKPVAHFKSFLLGADLEEKPISKKLMQQLSQQINAYSKQGGDPRKTIAALATHVLPSKKLLSEKAAELETRALELRRLSQMIHASDIQQRILKILKQEEPQINLLELGLLIAKLEHRELDVEGYLLEFKRLAAAAQQTLSEEFSEREKVERLGKFLFQESGFHGSRGEYYHRSNSFLNEVLDDREGIPITLSVIYIELARMLDIPHVYGIPLPGHFVVGYRPKPSELQMFDTFEAGKAISQAEAADLVRGTTGQALDPRSLVPSSNRSIALRMLNNLINVEINGDDPTKALPYLDLLLAIEPKRAPERFERSRIRFQADNRDGAIADLQWMVDNKPAGVNIDMIRQLLERVQ